jgi:hypothetical protein
MFIDDNFHVKKRKNVRMTDFIGNSSTNKSFKYGFLVSRSKSLHHTVKVLTSDGMSTKNKHKIDTKTVSENTEVFAK